MEIRVNNITKEEAVLAERYVKTYGAEARYMTREEMSRETGMPDYKCKAVMNALVKHRILQMVYGIYCPECGALADKSTSYRNIHRSGYRCGVCRAEVRYDRDNFGKLYAPKDGPKMKEFLEFHLAGRAAQ